MLSGPSVCAAAVQARLHGGVHQEASKWECGSVRSFGSGRRLRTGGRVSGRGERRERNWVHDFAGQGGREVWSFAAADDAGTQVDNVGGSFRNVEDSNVEAENRVGGESRMGGDGGSFEGPESGSGREISDVENGMTENTDNVGKIAESATERLLENSGASSGGGARMPQAEASDVGVGLGDAGFRRQVAMATDAGAALEMIAGRGGTSGGKVVGSQACAKLILDALALGNSELAFSVLKAMRRSVIQRRVDRDG